MKLKKLFNNVIFLRILIVIMIILLSYLMMRKSYFQSYVFQTSSKTLVEAVDEIKDMNRLSKVIINRKSTDVNSIDFAATEKLIDFSYETASILELNNYHDSWREIRFLQYNINRILNKENIDKGDLEYLKKTTNYLDQITELYEDYFYDDINYYDKIILGENKFFKDYKLFMKSIDQLFNEEDFKSLRDFEILK